MVTPARKIGENLFAVPSFSGDREFIVNLAGVVPTCSCPDFHYRRAGTNRGPCKHIVATQAQAPRIELLEKARRCSDAQLAGLLEKYGNVSPEIGGALRVARAERKAEQILRDVFA